jgi:spore germination protein
LNGADRDRYSAFVYELAKMLHASKRKISVTVHPKQTDDGGWDGARAVDYKALGTSADRFNVMTYDMHWSDSDPGALAENNWVNNVINYAKSRIPASKLGMGVACYGYDWNVKPATSLVWDDFTKRKYTIDEASSEYKDGKAYFSGAKAVEAKFRIAQAQGLGAIAMWYCGSEDPAIWDFLPRRK